MEFQEKLEDRLAICRYLVGPKLSGILGLPETPAITYAKMRVTFFAAALPQRFGKFYLALLPIRGRAWEEKRKRLVMEAGSRALAAKLRKRRTAFRPRTLEGNLGEGVEELELVSGSFKSSKVMYVLAWSALILEMVLLWLSLVLLIGLMGSRLVELGF